VYIRTLHTDRETDRQTDRHTDALEIITLRLSRVVKKLVARLIVSPV